MRKKGITILLSIFLGLLGIHKFYLGQVLRGVGRLFLFLFCIIVSVDSQIPKDYKIIIPLCGIFWIVDIFWYSLISDESFQRWYSHSQASVGNSPHSVNQFNIDNRNNQGSIEINGHKNSNDNNFNFNIR